MPHPPTEKLFWSDPALTRFDARLLEVREGGAGVISLVLDRTAFYPEGGGQPDDRGVLAGGKVLAVREGGDEVVVHDVEIAGSRAPSPGDRVIGEVDAGRRRDHRQQHSGQHLLSAVLLGRFAATTVSFHLGPESCTIDLDRELTDVELASAEEETNREIGENRAVSPAILSREELARLDVRKAPPEGVSRIRIVEIAGVDRTPCGGTHVDGTGELRLVSLLGRERRKGGMRVEFVVGDRAVALARDRAAWLREATPLLDCSGAELPARVRGLVEESKRTRRELEKARELLVGHEADAIAAGAAAGGFVARMDDRTLDEATALARALAARGVAAFLLARAKGAAGLAVASPAGGRSAAEVAKGVAELLGGRGGGNAAFARYGAADGADFDGALARAPELLRPATPATTS